VKFPDLQLAGIVEDPKELRVFDRDLLTSLVAWAQGLKGILERGISLDDNVDLRRVSVASHATPGTEFSVAHTLGKVPLGYFVCGQAGAGSVYDGATANNKTTLYLKSDVGSVTFRLVVF
jgi:hypothetical protein